MSDKYYAPASKIENKLVRLAWNPSAYPSLRERISDAHFRFLVRVHADRAAANLDCGTQEGITFAISQTHYAKAFLQPRPKWRNLETPHNDLEPLRRSNSFEGANRLLTFA